MLYDLITFVRGPCGPIVVSVEMWSVISWLAGCVCCLVRKPLTGD